MTKTTGVLGGMGPYATLDFLRLLLDLTAPQKESDHFRVLVDNNPTIPSRTRAFLFGEADPVPKMKEGVQSLMSAGADFIVVPCNSAHYFLPRVFDGISIPYVDMIEATSIALAKEGWTKVGVLAGEVTVGARLYESHLDAANISVVQVNSEEQKRVRQIIEDVKDNSITVSTESTLLRLFGLLTDSGAQSVVLGCTELQAVARNLNINCPIVDSLEVLARETIAQASRPGTP